MTKTIVELKNKSNLLLYKRSQLQTYDPKLLNSELGKNSRFN